MTYPISGRAVGAERWVARSPLRAWFHGRAVFLLAGLIIAAVVTTARVAIAEDPATRSAPTSGPMPNAEVPYFPPVGSKKGPAFYHAADALHMENDTLVAIVEGRNVRIEDVSDAIAALPKETRALDLEILYPMVLEGLIARAAVLNAASRDNFDNDVGVRRRMRAAAEQVLETEYLRHITNGQITEETIRDRYQREYPNGQNIHEAKVRVILMRDEPDAWAVIAELKKGGDFAALARTRSVDTSGPNGGDIGFIRAAMFGPVQAQVLDSLKPGEFSTYPIRDRAGWSVIKVEERREVPPPTFDQAHDQIEQQLTQEAFASAVTRIKDQTRTRRYNLNGTAMDEPLPDMLDLAPENNAHH
jgi:peptidyl-prolyl cis-trans isomerase C